MFYSSACNPKCPNACDHVLLMENTFSLQSRTFEFKIHAVTNGIVKNTGILVFVSEIRGTL